MCGLGYRSVAALPVVPCLLCLRPCRPACLLVCLLCSAPLRSAQSTLLCHAVLCSALLYSAKPCSTLLCPAMLCSAILCYALHRTVLLYSDLNCSACRACLLAYLHVCCLPVLLLICLGSQSWQSYCSNLDASRGNGEPNVIGRKRP